MTASQKFLEYIKLLESNYAYISIAGGAGTGKTTLALSILSKLMKGGKSIWIQASEKFPKKRLTDMLKDQPLLLSYLMKNILIFPSKATFKNYSEQVFFLNSIILKKQILPPEIKFMIIDNISHHLRYESTKYKDINQKCLLFNKFFEQQIYPLIMFCKRQNISLIMIHEQSFNPKLGKNVLYFHKLFSRIKSLNIFLSKQSFKDKNLMKISLNNHSTSLNYKISQEGIVIIN